MALPPNEVNTAQFTSVEATFLRNFADLPYVWGDVFYIGSDLQVHRLAAGVDGEVLTTHAAGANPSWEAIAGSGTVTTVSVTTTNGFAGTVANATTTPAITITTSVNAPVLAGNGTAISAATTTGSGSTVVLNNTPTLITPVLGAATATSINGLTITSSTGTLTITNAKVLSVSNTLTFTGTDGSSVAFGAGGTVLYTTSTLGLTIGTTTIASGNDTRVLFNNAGVLGQYTISGSGSVAMTTSPSFTTPALGTPSAGVLTSCTGYTIANLAGAGTGVLAALAINVGSAGAFITFNGALGTPSSGTVTNLTGTASININGTVGATTPSTGVFTTLVAGSTTSLLLGTAGSAVGNIGFRNATSGTITLAPATGALGTVTMTLQAATDTIVARATTDTLTNKRMQPRTASSTTNSNLSPDLSTANVYFRTTQTATLTIDAPIGTPVIGEVITIYVDSAGAQTLTINGTYKPFGASFPASTTAGKTFMMTAQYNGTDWKTTWANAI